MNDMPTNDVLDDRDVIARLRSALDEVAASDAVVIETTDRRHPAAWLAVAAASVALVGGAGWALSHRAGTTTVVPGSSVAPATAPAPTVVPPATTTPVTTPSDTGATAAPWFTIDSAALSGSGVRHQLAGEGDDRPFFVTWRIITDAFDGFLFATVSPYAPEGAPEAEPGGSVDQLDPPDGQAWLVWPATSGDEFAAPTLQWSRSDGSLWTFTQSGLYSAVSTNPWIDLVFSSQPGSGVPIVLAEPGATMLSAGGPAMATYSESYTAADGGAAELVVADGGWMAQTIGAADVIDPITVAGQPGWRTSLPDGRIVVAWDTGTGWWAQLHLTPDLADEADAIVAAITPAGAAADAATPDQQYYVEARVVDDGNGGTSARVPVGDQQEIGLPILGLSWEDVVGEETVDGVLQAGPFLLTVTYDGTSFTAVFVGTPVPQVDPGPACGDSGDEVDLALDTTMTRLMGADQQALGIAQIVVPSTGDCSKVLVDAWFDTPLLRAALAPYGDTVDLRAVLTPVPGD